MAKKQPWELEREAAEIERIKNVYALQTTLSEKQQTALLDAVNILREFDCDYCEGYELFDASIPRRMIEIKERVQKEFFMTGGDGWHKATWFKDDSDAD
jgi:hypothetical protein